jgi:hypothetical protein
MYISIEKCWPRRSHERNTELRRARSHKIRIDKREEIHRECKTPRLSTDRREFLLVTQLFHEANKFARRDSPTSASRDDNECSNDLHVALIRSRNRVRRQRRQHSAPGRLCLASARSGSGGRWCIFPGMSKAKTPATINHRTPKGPSEPIVRYLHMCHLPPACMFSSSQTCSFPSGTPPDPNRDSDDELDHLWTVPDSIISRSRTSLG